MYDWLSLQNEWILLPWSLVSNGNSSILSNLLQDVVRSLLSAGGLISYAIYSRFNPVWIANADIKMDPQNSVIKTLWCTRSTWCCILSFKIIGCPVLEQKIFKRFYHIWACRPSWSYDHNHLKELSLPQPMAAPHKIWLQLAQWLLRRRCCRMDDLYCKLTYTVSLRLL